MNKKLFDLIQLIDATIKSAKLSHWGTSGLSFKADHEQFDEIYEILSDYEDQLAEKYVMAFNRSLVMTILYDRIINIPTNIYIPSENDPKTIALNLCNKLIEIENLINSINVKHKGIDNILGDLSDKLLTQIALLKARLDN